MKKTMLCGALLCFTTVVLTLFLTGCDLPTYNLGQNNSPESGIKDFINAVINENTSVANDLLYNYSLSDGSAVRIKLVSSSDIDIFEALRQSRSFKVMGGTNYLDSHTAEVNVTYTTFDMRKFKTAVSEKAVEIIKQKQYEGEKFQTASDTVDIIENVKLKLLEKPDEFYTTADFKIKMICHKGKWRVVLSDEFYNALLGYRS